MINPERSLAESSMNRTGRVLLVVFFPVLWLIGGVILLVILRNPPVWQLDVGAPGDTRFLSGFSIPEISIDNSTSHPTPTTFRWSIKGSRLILHGTPMGAFLLDMRLSGDANAGPLTLEYHEQPPGTMAHFAVAPGWRVYRVLLPSPPPVGWGEAPPLFLKTDTYASATRDQRSLGVPIDWLRLTPLRGKHPVWPAILWVMMLVWGLVVLTGWLWLADRIFSQTRCRWFSPLSRVYPVHLAPIRVGVVVTIVMLALMLWAMRDPYGMAWAIPPFPWILGIASLIVVYYGIRYGQTTYQVIAQHRSGMAWATHSGMMVLIIAQVLFYSNVRGGGIVCAACGIVLLALAPQPASSPSSSPIIHPGFLLFLLVLIALGLRFAYLDTIPYGMWRDEARHGLIAIRMLEDPGYRPVYIASEGVNMPALGFYPFALAIKLWGIHAWSMRPMIALAGALTIIPLYAFVVQLSKKPSVGLVAAALLAFSSWHISLSRFSFPSVFEPFLLCCGLWLMTITLAPASPGPDSLCPDDGPQTRPAILPQWLRMMQGIGAGTCLGLAMQHYHTGRVVPIVAGSLALVLVMRMGRAWRTWLPALIYIGIGAMLVLAPLVSYMLNHAAAFNNRVNKVFLLGDEARAGRSPLAVLDEAIGGHILMFNVQGDNNGRHHAPGFPLLDPITGLGFLAGCGVLLRRGDGRSLFLVMGLGAGVLPSLLAVEYPHAMRSIGAIVFACTIAATGLIELIRWMSTVSSTWISRIAHTSWSWWKPASIPDLTAVMGGGLLGIALVCNTWTYFVAMPTNPAVWLSFYPIHTKVGEFVRAEEERKKHRNEESDNPIYIPASLSRNSVFTYLTWGIPYQTYEDGKVSRPIGSGARFVISGYATPEDIDATLALLATTNGYPRDAFTAVSSGPVLPDGKHPSFLVYQLRSAASIP